MVPLNGGAQAYLAYAYNPLVSYLYTWTAVGVLKPGSNAIIALIFGLFYHATGSDIAPDAIPQWAIKLTAVIAIAVAVLGCIQILRGKMSNSLTDPLFAGTSPNPSSFALALYSGLWAFDGWDQVNYVAAEMKNIERDLPRVVHLSMFSVMVLYIAANVSYFAVLTKCFTKAKSMCGESTVARSNTVALDFGRELFGNIGAVVFACLVAVSCFGAVNGTIPPVALLGYVINCSAKSFDVHVGTVDLRCGSRKTPINAMGLQVGVTLFFILIGGGFRSMINFVGVAVWTFYFLTGLGLIVLRVREPSLPRPYRVYLITPLIFSGTRSPHHDQYAGWVVVLKDFLGTVVQVEPGTCALQQKEKSEWK
ncbi:hypothetical protein FRC10_003085 [Ceratobasidium sp. 414]|nr:hypothetical protein FRC10_003085 [Ceratobasidium sp. 414]